jgi:hypothetical protein
MEATPSPVETSTAAPRATDTRTPVQLMADHLTFLGYRAVFDTKVGNESVDVNHDARPYFRIYRNAGGICFLFPFTVGKGAEEDPPGLLRLLNDINSISLVTRYSYDLERKRLWVGAWHPYSYERVSFGVFFDRVQEEIAAPRLRFPEGVAKYLT